MPSRNVIKEYESGNYYHAYSRGVAKQPIFLDNQDKNKFLSILSRYLDPQDTSFRGDGVYYRKFDKDLELLCYCLMGNHFHLLFYLVDDPDALHVFIQSVLTAYTMYFNKRYKRVGTLFQGVFKASRITDDSYLLHITRYIHLNPKHCREYPFSSLNQYVGDSSLPWLKPARILNMFVGVGYLQYLEDYEDYAATLENLKYELANTP